MYFYKFRVFFDEVDDFVRDIEISSSDTFESFHHILYSSIGLSGKELSSFSICDPKWNKQKEITLIDMGDDEANRLPEYGDDDDFSTKSNIPKFVMSDCILKDFVSDPHQRIIYEYDFLNPKTFYIELLKILPSVEGVQYPRCSYKSKELPKENNNLHLPNPEDDFIEEFDDDDIVDDDYQDGLNEEDHYNLGSIDEFRDF